MKIKIERNKYSPAEVALLVIFAFGLLLSFLVVSARKKIQFSDPLEAPFDGITVSMPSGNGWQSQNKWQYSGIENAFAIKSVLVQSNVRLAHISWQYNIAAEEKKTEEIISVASSTAGFLKVRTENINIGGLEFTTLIFTSPSKARPDGIENYYYATARLPFGREIKLEVLAIADADFASRIFDSAIKKIKYTEDKRLAIGEDFIKRSKSSGAAALIKRETERTSRRIYLAREYSPANAINASEYQGFTIDVFSPGKDLRRRGGINASAFNYIDGPVGWIGSGLFSCDRSINNFEWKSKQSSLDKRRETGVEIKYADGVLRCYDVHSMTDRIIKERVYNPSPLSIPELFLDSLAAAFLDQNTENALIDIILPDGRIVPAEISKTAIAASPSMPTAVSAVRFSMYNKHGKYYELLFDQSGKIVGKIEKIGITFELKRTNIKEVIAQFDQWSDDLEAMLKQK